MLAGYGFDAIIAPALLSLRGREAIWSGDRFAIITLFGIVFYLFFNAGIFGLDIVGQSLSVEDRETIAWVETNIPHSNDFFLITGEQYSMNDPFQEWFPALTKQLSFTTLQGKEWTLAENFFPFYGELVDLQHCADADCVVTWGKPNKLKHDYLLVKKYPQGGTSQLQISLEWLLQSIQESAN